MAFWRKVSFSHLCLWSVFCREPKQKWGMGLPAPACSPWQSWEWGSRLDPSFGCGHGLPLQVRWVRGVKMAQNWVQWLIGQRVVLLFGGTWTGWKNGLTGTSRSSAKRNAKSCPWGGTTPCIKTGWGCPAGKQLGRKGLKSPGGHRLDHEPVMCPCYQQGKWCSELH